MFVANVYIMKKILGIQNCISKRPCSLQNEAFRHWRPDSSYAFQYIASQFYYMQIGTTKLRYMTQTSMISENPEINRNLNAQYAMCDT